MCGIFACFHNQKNISLSTNLNKLKHRGPDNHIITQLKNITFEFSHLRINGYGNQPLTNGKWFVICNGEIFNHKKIEMELDLIPPPNSSDCWILPYMFDRYEWRDIPGKIDGVFSLIAYNIESNTLYIARDPFGIRPLFISEEDSVFYVASELKALKNLKLVDWVNPATTMKIDFKNYEIKYEAYTYYNLINKTIADDFSKTYNDVLENIQTYLIKSVQKRCLSDRPIAALLSGGLDSSIICSILSKIMNGRKLHTFSIGIENSPDLKYAKKVSDYLGTIHHEILCTDQDFINNVGNVIKDIESFDTTTVRASIGNWLLGQYISKTTDFKVIFNGDGSDELFGGYLYMQKAPTNIEFKNEVRNLLLNIHMFDVLRSDRSMTAHGLEPRTPFLDKQFVSYVYNCIPIEYFRNGMEKQLLRDAFKGYLPLEILQRKKEAFSDGVINIGSKPWYKTYLQNEKEYYLNLFKNYYPNNQNIIPYYWMPKWSPETTDPSARTLTNY
jgi:asparagine synthase (glutamine-hydrolysing)